MEKYDVVVIGAGNGGLTSAAILAQKGLGVLLLERHNIPGGCATSFCRGRFEFEVALHQLSGMGSPGRPGPLRGLLGDIGVLDDLEFVEMPDLYSVRMPDGFRITLQADRSMAVAQLQESFPGEAEAIERFFDLAYRYAQEMLAVFYFRDPSPSREKYPVLYSHAFRPAMEVLDESFSDPLLKAVLSVYWSYVGLPPTRLSFAYLAMLLFTYLEFKPFHIKGGSQALSNAILNRFLASGGTARFNCGAERILVGDGAVKGVVTEHGDEISARCVVSNVSQLTTYLQLMEPEEVPPQALQGIRGRSISPSAFSMFIGLDCEPGALGIESSTNFILAGTDLGDGIIEAMRRPDIAEEAMLLSCYDVSDPEFSPPGTCQANVVTLKYGEPWLRVPPSRYWQLKYRYAEAMLRRVEEVFPGVRGHIEELEVATPLTFMRYLGHPYGAIYGFEHYTKDAMFFQPSRESPVRGLYFASGWVGDMGFEPTLQAGRRAATSVLKLLRGEA